MRGWGDGLAFRKAVFFVSQIKLAKAYKVYRLYQTW